jgi:GNAT superfamily N-acetyltransferase
MGDLADDLVRFWTALDSGLERVEPTWWGAVVTDRRFPDVWDVNYARVETADASVSLHDVDRPLAPALAAATAAAVHVVMFRPEATARLLSDLTGRGDRLSWDVVMMHEREPPPSGRDVAEELRVDEDLWVRVAASLPSFGVTEPETIRQLLRMEREVLDPGATKRWFGVRDGGGDVVALGALVLLAGLGYVDHVITLPHARGRGHARAVVTRIVREARAAGVDRTFLLVDPEGPVPLYEHLGFREATRIASTLAPRQIAGCGR